MPQFVLPSSGWGGGGLLLPVSLARVCRVMCGGGGGVSHNLLSILGQGDLLPTKISHLEKDACLSCQQLLGSLVFHFMLCLICFNRDHELLGTEQNSLEIGLESESGSFALRLCDPDAL